MSVIDIVGGKVGINPPDRDYKPAEPYRRNDVSSRERQQRDEDNKRIKEQLREAIAATTEPFTSGDMVKRLGLGAADTSRIGMLISVLAKEGACWCIKNNQGSSQHNKYLAWERPVETPPVKTQYQSKINTDHRNKLLKGMAELGGVDVSPLDLLAYLDIADTKENRQACGQIMHQMAMDGLVEKGDVVQGMRMKKWSLAEKPEIDVEELAVEVALADLKKRMTRPELPANSDRIVVELRGVARQFQEIGASEVLINDFCVLADWIEELRK